MRLLVAVVITAVPMCAMGHGGGLDAYGCHNDRHTGLYHCHRGQFKGKSFPSQHAMLEASKATPAVATNNQPAEAKRDERGRIERSHTALAEFRHAHPCPVTGKEAGSCPGFVIDHIKPLCAGGLDHPSNMQWQTVADAKKKDRLEREMCSKHSRERI